MHLGGWLIYIGVSDLGCGQTNQTRNGLVEMDRIVLTRNRIAQRSLNYEYFLPYASVALKSYLYILNG